MADADAEGRFWNSPRVVDIFAGDDPAGALKAHLLLSNEADRAAARTLDLGCGAGRNSALMADMGYNVWSCDAHSEMVAQTSRRLSPHATSKVVQADMLALPYGRAAFNLVVSNGVFHNAYSMADFGRAVEEVARVLEPGGRLYLNVFVLGGTSLAEQRLTVLDQEQRVYLTVDRLRMTLPTAAELLEVLAITGLEPTGSRLYSKREFTGLRDICQGIWQKRR